MARGEMRADTKEFVYGVKRIIEGLRSYWPLTLRQIYYQLVASQVIDNNLHEYQKLSRVLSQARLDGMVPWEAMEDRARQKHSHEGWDNAGQFERAHMRNFLKGYKRDCLQSQSTRLEIWVEKDALSGVVNRAAEEWGVDVIVARGFSSMSFKHECYKRVLENEQAEKSTKILYFGDFDPSGWEMLPAMLRTLHDEMGLDESQVEGVRCALTLEQVEDMGLPHSPDALKETDSRAKKFVDEFGEIAVELDAISPAELEKMVSNAIEDNIDVDLYEQEKDIEEKDITNIKAIRSKVMKLIEDNK